MKNAVFWGTNISPPDISPPGQLNHRTTHHLDNSPPDNNSPDKFVRRSALLQLCVYPCIRCACIFAYMHIYTYVHTRIQVCLFVCMYVLGGEMSYIAGEVVRG